MKKEKSLSELLIELDQTNKRLEEINSGKCGREFQEKGKALTQYLKLKSADYIYTGGNIYLFYGILENGNGFLADGDMFDVRLVDTLPEDPNIMIDSVEWQEDHLVKDLDTETEGPRFIYHLINYIRENPNGYYDPYLDNIREEAFNLIGKTNWR